MADQRAGSRFAAIFSFLVTAMVGAGIGGLARPDIPFLSEFVRKYVVQSPVPDGESSLTALVQSRLGTSTQITHAAPIAKDPHAISVASYNIQVFGSSKLAKREVMDVLVQVVRRFDVVAIQEVRSQDDAIIPTFVQMINSNGSRYAYVIGPRLGRTVSTEQYAFIFDTTRIEVDPASVLTISDPADSLHREPLLARFRARTPDPNIGFTFWLMNVHTDPDEVPQELDALSLAYQSVQQRGWGEDDVILLGDLNASETQLGALGRIPDIYPAIAQVPTNTRGSKTYDNLLFCRQPTVEFTGQAGVLNVMQEYGLSEEQALKVSDHLPVWAMFSAFEGYGQPGLARRH